MSKNNTPRFHFEVDGKKYGARFLTVGETIQMPIDLDKLTSGKYNQWIKQDSSNIEKQAAFLANICATLSKVIVQFPEEPLDFSNSDDTDFIFKLWEGYAEKAEEFRKETGERDSDTSKRVE